MTLAGHRCIDEYEITKRRTHNFVRNYQSMGFDQGETGDMQLRFFVFKSMDDEVEWFTYSYVEDYFLGKRSGFRGIVHIDSN